MKSSFKSAYDKVALPDGTIELTYKDVRLSAHTRPKALVVVTPFAIILFVILTLVFFSIFNSVGGAVFLSVIVTGFAILFLYKKTFGKPGKILLTKEGIIFWHSGKKQLPFSEVARFVIKVETMSGVDYDESFCIYAEAGGKEIPLTKPLQKKALAEAILDEIQTAQVK